MSVEATCRKCDNPIRRDAWGWTHKAGAVGNVRHKPVPKEGN